MTMLVVTLLVVIGIEVVMMMSMIMMMLTLVMMSPIGRRMVGPLVRLWVLLHMR